MKSLILGHTGFVGKSLFEYLTAQGHSVVGLSTAECDLRDYNSFYEAMRKFEKVDVIYNLAANVGSVHYVTAKAAEVITDNGLMAINLYKAVNELNPDAIIINPISNCCYANGSTLQDERKWLSGPVHPSVFSFGNFKRMLYYISKCYDMQYNIKSVNLMLPGIYGPGDSTDPNKVHALNGMIIRMLACQEDSIEEFEIWGTGKPIREWIFIDDVCKIMLTAAENKESLIEPVNLAQGKGYSIEKTAGYISKAVGYSGALTFNTDYQDGAPIKILKVGKMKEIVGDFEFYNHEMGIAKTVEYYKETISYEK
ncbi:MAG TPA: hypothetical protein DCX27_12010 [Balneola sp.]|jgi:GDP-L-fucose synthase|nr:hypothetical protein [Balneola sp.]|tara:strand:- start:554 stop:1486 length:933 start_codon:yes stop_codon:yes gene_type:complete